MRTPLMVLACLDLGAAAACTMAGPLFQPAALIFAGSAMSLAVGILCLTTGDDDDC